MTATNVSAPTWSVVGPVSPTFTDNALFSRDDRRPDVYYEPDVSVRLDGYLTPEDREVFSTSAPQSAGFVG